MTTPPDSEYADRPESLGDSSQWQAALLAAPRDELVALAGRLAEGLEVVELELPRAGLTMTRLQDSVSGGVFNLGEAPLSTASVRVTFAGDPAPGGRSADGYAALMVDDAARASAAAVCDAVLRGRLPGWPDVADVVAAGLQAIDDRNRRRRGILASTRVNFSELGQEG